MNIGFPALKIWENMGIESMLSLSGLPGGVIRESPVPLLLPDPQIPYWNEDIALCGGRWFNACVLKGWGTASIIPLGWLVVGDKVLSRTDGFHGYVLIAMPLSQ